MKHPLDHRSSLPPLPRLQGRNDGLRDWLHLAAGCGGCLVSLPLMLLWAVPRLVLAMLAGVQRSEDTTQEATCGPAGTPVVQGEYDADRGSVEFRMNAPALAGFASALGDLYNTPKQAPVLGIVRGPFVRESGPTTPGWHTHTDMLMPELPVELTIGTGEGLLEVQEGTILYASADEWRRVTAEWKRIAEAGEACLIVLDRDQAGWCSPASTGRLVIVLQPELEPASPP